MKERHILLCILALGFVLRLIFVFYSHPADEHLYSDMGGYHTRAMAILRGEFNPLVFFQGVGYPLLISQFLSEAQGKVTGFLSFRLFQFALGCLTPLFVWLYVRKLLGARIALTSAAITALHFPFIYYNGFYLTETLFTLLVAVFLSVLAFRDKFANRWAWGLAAGTIFGAAYWLKGTFAFFPFLFAFWSLAEFLRTDKKNWLRFPLSESGKPVIAFAVSCGIFVLAHGFYSQAKIGVFQLSASAGGLNLVEGKCPSKINWDSDGSWWHSPLFVQLNERTTKTWPVPFTNAPYYTREGLKCIAENPLVLVESVRYIGYLFYNNEPWPIPNPDHWTAPFNKFYNALFPLFLLPGLCVGLLLIWRARGGLSGLCFILPIVTLFFTAWIFKSELRYRVPYDVVMIPLAVFGWSRLVQWVKQEAHG